MKRDTIKTLAGLVIIGVIVVATFLYGNAQRQTQLRHDQDVRKQQEAKASAQVKSRPATPQVATTAVPAHAATAPVQSPASNTIQGSRTATPGPTGQVAGVQDGKAKQSDLPQTGSPLMGLLGATAVAGAAVALRRSKLAVPAAARR